MTPWTTAHQASLSITDSQSLPKLMFIESVMPSNHLILCRLLLLLPSIFPSIRVFSNESALHIRYPKYWSFSFNISPSNEHSVLISFWMDWLDVLASKGLSRAFSGPQLSKPINSLTGGRQPALEAGAGKGTAGAGLTRSWGRRQRDRKESLKNSR